jgi:hypothetical protein
MHARIVATAPLDGEPQVAPAAAVDRALSRAPPTWDPGAGQESRSMNRNLLPIAAVLPLVLLAALGRSHGGDAGLHAPAGDPTHADLAPQGALIYLEFQDSSDLLTLGLEHPLARTLLASGTARAILSPWAESPAGALAMLDERAGFPVLPALADVGARGAALSVSLQGAKPAWLVSLHGADESAVKNALERALASAAEKFGYPGAFDEPAERRDGVELWRIGPELAIARRETWILAAGDEEGVRAALARMDAGRGTGLSASEDFRDVYAAREGGATLWGWLALAKLRALQEIADGDEGLVELAAAAAQPSAQFLLGPALALIGRSRTLSLGLEVRGEDLAFTLGAQTIDGGAAAALLPALEASASAIPPGGSRNQLAAVLYRDMAGIFRDRADLFAPQAQPGFAEAESNLALFFGGRDVEESLLPHIDPWIGVLVRPVVFDARAQPEAPLPALALLARVDDPEAVGRDLVAGFQTMISLINVDRAQKGQDALLLELDAQSGVTVTAARFRPPNPEDGVDLRYNLEPACALVGNTFVVATHRALVKELVRELSAQETPGASGRGGEWLRLSGPALADAVRQHSELLVMSQVLEKGKSQERARAEIEYLREILELVELFELDVRRTAASAIRVDARLDLRRPESGR